MLRGRCVTAVLRRPTTLRARRLSTTTEQGEPKKEEWSWAPYVVFGIVGSLGAWFWRASTGQSNRMKVLTEEEEKLALDEKELSGLREANTALTTEIFTDLGRGCARQFGGLDARTTYPAFIRCAAAYLDRPLQQGHLVDRVVVSSSKRSSDFELGFLVAALGLAVNGTPDERAEAYAKIIADSDQDDVSAHDLEAFLSWLQQSGHIKPDVLVVETKPNYPAQHYTVKTSKRILDDLATEAHLQTDGASTHWSQPQVVAALTSKHLKLFS